MVIMLCFFFEVNHFLLISEAALLYLTISHRNLQELRITSGSRNPEASRLCDVDVVVANERL